MPSSDSKNTKQIFVCLEGSPRCGARFDSKKALEKHCRDKHHGSSEALLYRSGFS
ncbi:hypothetical protein DOTSEDRAFT_67916 [Dothistroma septosporum NZE10]|uniref:C2H2-type domain-containing protein n=1 Tax=Dothistroma septosporum (strain NZE10 / CBS 128990) TaxID=675120 RepID=N1Q194_DOTSN|nr:hypothetical protein DOTSEDRAFT_67916 [Dothistroma septosporum NZE10]